MKCMRIYKPTREKLREARKRLENRDPIRGTAEERIRHQLDVYRDMKPFRDQATKETLGFTLEGNDDE